MHVACGLIPNVSRDALSFLKCNTSYWNGLLFIWIYICSGGGKNLEGRRAYLAYVAEGIGKLQDWDMAMKYQRKNGSLFNSPSATASAFIHIQDAECLHYIRSLLQKFGNAGPAT